MKIRPADIAEIHALSELAGETYTHAFGHSLAPSDLTAHLQKHLSPERFSQMVKDDVILVADEGGRLRGYVQFGKAIDFEETSPANSQELRRLYVHSDYQNQGIGRALMDSAFDHPWLKKADCIYLDVWEHNHGAQRFYKRYGFEIAGTRRFEVESGAETGLDLIMVRKNDLNDSTV